MLLFLKYLPHGFIFYHMFNTRNFNVMAECLLANQGLFGFFDFKGGVTRKAYFIPNFVFEDGRRRKYSPLANMYYIQFC